MKPLTTFVLGTFALLSLAACEEDVASPRTEKPFSVYGLLSPAQARQEVYVFPIEEHLRPLPPEPLDARVTTTDLTTGETVVWQDSVQAAADMGYAYVFRAPLRINYGHAYRLEVERSDGATARAEVAVPEEAALVIDSTYIDGSGHPITPAVVDRPVPQLLHLSVIYDVQRGPSERLRETFTLDVEYAYAARALEGGWAIDVDHRSDYEQLLGRLEQADLFNPNYGLYVYTVTLELLVASADWAPPGGAFDPEVLAQPGVMTNVENGYGFVGAGYRREVTWRPPDEMLIQAGFREAP